MYLLLHLRVNHLGVAFRPTKVVNIARRYRRNRERDHLACYTEKAEERLKTIWKLPPCKAIIRMNKKTTCTLEIDHTQIENGSKALKC